MRFKHALILFVTAMYSIAVSSAQSETQSDVSVSLTGGISIGHSWLDGQLWNELDLPWKCDCDATLYTGLYVAPFVGADIKFAGIMHAGLQIGVQSTTTSGIDYIDTIPYDSDGNGNVLWSTLERSTSIAMFDVLTRLFVGVELPLEFTVEVGINAPINVSNEISGMLRITSNDTSTFVDYSTEELSADRRTMYFKGTEIPQFPSMRVDVDVCIGRVFTFGDATLHPQVLYRHGLSNLYPSERLFSRALAGTLIFKYNL